MAAVRACACLLGLLLGAVGAGRVVAAEATAPAASPMAQPVDGMEARVLACTVCHGKEGRATNQGYFPRIAGKPAGYLYHQLLNFQEGRRRYLPMVRLLEHVTDGYLQEIAGYFAAQDLPYPPPQTSGAAPATLERGRALVQDGDQARGIPACVSCHGARMTGVSPFIPGLLGLPRDYLNSQLGAWQTGERKAQAPDCMADIARRLKPEDVSAVSTWLSSQTLADSHPAASLPAALPVACGSVQGAGAAALR